MRAPAERACDMAEAAYCLEGIVQRPDTIIDDVEALAAGQLGHVLRDPSVPVDRRCLDRSEIVGRIRSIDAEGRRATSLGDLQGDMAHAARGADYKRRLSGPNVDTIDQTFPGG